MNKKVLTLCVSALLAGGLIGTANAAKLTDVVDNGKYYQLKMSKKSDGTNWAATPTTWAAQYLSIDADGPSFLTTPDAKEGFWTIVDVQKPGESLPTQTTGKIQLVNASTGKPLSITFGTAPNTKVIDEFYTEDGPTGDVLGLVFYEGGVRYQLGGVSTTGTTPNPNIGGLVGWLASGSISASSASATFDVAMGSIGGLVGQIQSPNPGSITLCYASGSLNIKEGGFSSSNVGGLIGKTFNTKVQIRCMHSSNTQKDALASHTPTHKLTVPKVRRTLT